MKRISFIKHLILNLIFILFYLSVVCLSYNPIEVVSNNNETPNDNNNNSNNIFSKSIVLSEEASKTNNGIRTNFSFLRRIFTFIKNIFGRNNKQDDNNNNDDVENVNVGSIVSFDIMFGSTKLGILKNKSNNNIIILNQYQLTSPTQLNFNAITTTETSESSNSIIGSVKFIMTGNSTHTEIDNIKLYAACGNNELIFSSCNNLKLGTTTLTAIPYSNLDGTGSEGLPLSVTFTLLISVPIQQSPIPLPVSIPSPNQILSKVPIQVPRKPRKPRKPITTAPVNILTSKPVKAPILMPVSVPTSVNAPIPSPISVPVTVPITVPSVPNNTPIPAPIPAPIRMPVSKPTSVNAPILSPLSVQINTPINAPTQVPMSAPTKMPKNPRTTAPQSMETKAPIPIPVITKAPVPMPVAVVSKAPTPKPAAAPTPKPVAAPTSSIPSPLINGKWIETNSNAPIDKRHEGCFLMVGRKAVLLGGRGKKNTDIYDPITRTWTVGASPPVNLHHMQCVSIGNKVWIVAAWTGFYPTEINTNFMYVYDVSTDVWEAKPPMPENRRRGSTAVVVVGNKIYVAFGNIGGHETANHAISLSWLDVYDINTNKWTVLPDARFPRDHTGGALMKDGRICVAGGRDGGTINWPVVLQTECYNITSQTWSIEANIPTGRAGSAYDTSCDGNLIIAGGEIRNPDSASNAFDMFDGNKWISLSNLNIGRHGTGLAVNCFCNEIYIASGSANAGGTPEVRSVETFFPNGVDTQCLM